MSNCCGTIQHLGCISCVSDAQGQVTIPKLLPDVTGTYKLEFELAGTYTIVEFTVAVIDTLIKVDNHFNEDYQHQIKVYRPDGTLLHYRYDDGGIQEDLTITCFSLTVKPTFEV